MKKRKFNIILTTPDDEKKYSLLGEYDQVNGIICYKESSNLLTEVVLDLNKKILTRDNLDYYLKYELIENKETKNEIRIKDLNQNMILMIKTQKFEITENKIEIIYTVLDSNETIHYQIMF